MYIFVGNDVNNIGHNFVNAVNKDLRDNTETYGKLKDAFAKAKSNSYILSCNDTDDSTNWTYNKIINEYSSENDIIIDVNIDIIKDIHYSRNDYNTYNGGDFPNPINDDIKNNWNDNVPANAHQFNRPWYDFIKSNRNIKYVDESGRIEAIYDKKGNYLSDDENVGTYNFAPSNSLELGNTAFDQHKKLDVEPWFEWGNTINDSTNKLIRIISIGRVY